MDRGLQRVKSRHSAGGLEQLGWAKRRGLRGSVGAMVWEVGLFPVEALSRAEHSRAGEEKALEMRRL